MKKYILSDIIFITLFSLASLTPLSLAQGSSSEEREDEIAADEEMSEHMSGTLINIVPGLRQLTIQEDDSDETYQISVNRNANIEGAGSLSDIAAGAVLDIDYYTVNDRLIATNIVVVEESARQEATETAGKVFRD